MLFRSEKVMQSRHAFSFIGSPAAADSRHSTGPLDSFVNGCKSEPFEGYDDKVVMSSGMTFDGSHAFDFPFFSSSLASAADLSIFAPDCPSDDTIPDNYMEFIKLD